MNPSSELFELVKTLTASEKRYFKIFAGKSGGKKSQNYMKVFEALDKVEDYVEKDFLKSLDDPKLKRQFPVLKNYLYKLILKSLRNYHSEQSLDAQIHDLLVNTELLLVRDLPQNAAKQLKKASKLAVENERFEFFSEIGILRISLAMKMRQDDLDLGFREVEGIFKETNDHFATFQELQLYRMQSLRMLFLNRKETVARSEQARLGFEEAIAHPLLAGPPPEKPLKARMFYFQSHFIYHLANSDYKSAFQDVSKLVSMMEDNPWMISERPENYVNSLQNQGSISTYVNPLEIARPLLDKMKFIQQRFPKIQFGPAILRRIPLYAYNQEVHVLVKSGNFDEAAKLLPEMEDLLSTVKDNDFNLNEGFILMSLYTNLAHLLLSQSEFRRSLYYVELILESGNVSDDYEVYRDARVLKVILFFELGEEELLEYALLSLHRFLRKQEQLHGFEMAWIEFINKSAQRQPGESLLCLFAKLRADLQALKENVGESRWSGSFDMVAWLDTKIPEEK